MLIMIHTINHGEHFRDYRQSGYDIGRGGKGNFQKGLKNLIGLEIFKCFEKVIVILR